VYRHQIQGDTTPSLEFGKSGHDIWRAAGTLVLLRHNEYTSRDVLGGSKAKDGKECLVVGVRASGMNVQGDPHGGMECIELHDEV
jgi:hypothetical protein